MKKISMLIFYRDYQQFLEELRELGVVHIHENKVRSAEDETLHVKSAQIKQLGDMILKMKNRGQTERVLHIKDEDCRTLEGHLRKKFHDKEQIVQQLDTLQKEISIYELWGDFSQQRVKELAAAGCKISFYALSEQKFPAEWTERQNLIEINHCKGQKYFIVVTGHMEEAGIEADVFQFPEASKDELQKRMEKFHEEYAAIEKYLDEIAVDAIEKLTSLRESIYEISDEMHVKNASNCIVDEKVMALEGWVPADREEELKAFFLKQDVYFEISKSTKEDEVPVLLKNGRFSRLFEPIGALYDLANYRELDLTVFFAPFFMLFFGLCMGDGGYGLLIWLACIFLKRKMPDKMQGYLKLGQYLGVTTIVVGIITGSFFGIALDVVTWSWLQGIKTYFLTQDNFGQYVGGYNPMMFIAFAIGVIQILLGMCLNVAKIVKQHGFKYAVSETAWVILLMVSMFTFGLPALGVTLPLLLIYIFYGVLGICGLSIFLYNAPDKNLFVNIGAGIWGSYNMATGLLGDILSYVRLFALGLTGSILGSVFNMLAFDMTASMPVVVKFLIAFLILIIGHALNLAIAMIGAFVHPMRLTFVEFYKNAGFEGMGKKYAPFRERVNKNK